MQCPACGGETPGDKRFCANCGTTLVAPTCAACGAQLIAGKAFCSDCGARVEASARARPIAERESAAHAPPRTAAPAEAPVAERRICSVLFVDLVGFTPLAERRDPEEIRELLSKYFDRAQTIIGHYGGIVEKFIGDAVMAVWGAPVANEDDPERAVRAGLEVVASVSALGLSAGIPELAARGGVVTGEVAITIGKVGEGMVLGDTVNSASRVQSVASPGAVLVDESTWRATGGAIAYAEVGELTLKGKEERIHAWQALRVVAQRKGVGRTEGLEPPFVGRDTDLQLIKDLLHATMREQRARLVSVTGVPGIGKSRLAWEFLKYVDGLADTVYWHQGRSPAYGDGITFWALGEMVRMRAGITESDDAAASRAKLTESVGTFVSDPDELKWIEVRLAHLLGLTDDAPGGDREELFSSWRTYFERVAETGPAVMVFEDLQWADPGLVDFVESILEWSRNHAILVLTLSRPELADRRPTWGAGQRNFTSLHLDPLSTDAMRALLGGFVRDLPDDVASQVLARSEGVPLYAVEMVRSLVDRGVLVETEGAYTITGDLASFEIPETLHALIGSRLDALPPEQRTLLQDAAVLGTTFSSESLAAIQGVERAKLDADLRDLVRKEFLVVDTDPRSPERGHFGFVQSLIQEVATARLARRDRSAKHLAVARHLESLGDDELTAAVAAHYVEAFRAAPDGDDANRLGADARQWLSRAGNRAKSLGSPEQALGLFEQALQVTSGSEERAAVLDAASESAQAISDYPRAIACAEEALALHRQSGDANAAARSTRRLAFALVSERRYPEAIDVASKAFEAEDELDDAVRAALGCEIAMAQTHSGHADIAVDWAERALALAERGDDDQLFAHAIGVKSAALFQLGRHRESVILARGMAVIAEAGGNLLEHAIALLGLSVFALQDAPRESLTAGIQSAELAKRAGHRGFELTNLLNVAEGSVYVGDWDETRRSLAELAQRQLSPENHWWYECIEAMIAGGTGDEELALRLIASSREATEKSDYIHQLATMLSGQGFVLLCLGDLAAARIAAEEGVAADPLGINAAQSLDIAARASIWQADGGHARSSLEALERFRGRFAAVTRLTISAGLAALDGDPTLATERYSGAFAGWRTLDCQLPLALAILDYATVLGPDDTDPAVIAEARDIFTSLGASPFLDRLSAASERSQ